MKQRVVFLDIDGTLLDFQGNLPESAGRALRKARENGHQLVLCTGRTRIQVYAWLLEQGFDGLITGAGAQVEAHGHVISRHLIRQEHLAEAVAYFEKNRTPYYMQAENAIYGPQWCLDCRIAVFGGRITDKEREKRFGKVTLDDMPQLRRDVEKIAYYQSAEPLDGVRAALGEYFTVEASSYSQGHEGEGEVTIRGIDKAYGMQQYLAYTGFAREDAVAVGDGPNDLEMLQYAGTGVAMGNAMEALKAAADLVTDDVNRDGLYHAFERLRLI